MTRCCCCCCCVLYQLVVMSLAVKSVVAAAVCVGTLVTNVPVVVTVCCTERMRTDHVAMVMASICVADIGVGTVTSAISAVLAWSRPDTVPAALCAFQVSARVGFVTSCPFRVVRDNRHVVTRLSSWLHNYFSRSLLALQLRLAS